LDGGCPTPPVSCASSDVYDPRVCRCIVPVSGTDGGVASLDGSDDTGKVDGTNACRAAGGGCSVEPCPVGEHPNPAYSCGAGNPGAQCCFSATPGAAACGDAGPCRTGSLCCQGNGPNGGYFCTDVGQSACPPA
jgi:hypothetical protein